MHHLPKIYKKVRIIYLILLDSCSLLEFFGITPMVSPENTGNTDKAHHLYTSKLIKNVREMLSREHSLPRLLSSYMTNILICYPRALLRPCS